MRNIIVIAAVILQPVVARAVPLPVSIHATFSEGRVHRGETYGVVVETSNPTSQPVQIEIESCGWKFQWQSGDPAFEPGSAICASNVPGVFQLAPGQVDRRTLIISVMPKAALGFHAVRFGFTPLDRKDISWSEPATVDVVEASKAITVPSHGLTFKLTNQTNAPIDIMSTLTVERLGFGWGDPGATAVNCTPQMLPVCTTTPAHDTTGLCELSVTEPGTYRVVATSCDGTRDFVGGELVAPKP